MKFKVIVRTATAVHTFDAIGVSSFAVLDAALVTFGVSAISVRAA